jgi:hypothetical protein
MPRLAYITELDPISIAQLQAAGALIQAILEGIQVVEVPEEGEAPSFEETLVESNEPTPSFDGTLAPDFGETRTPDPNFLPPAPLPPMNNQQDFGAGPPPSGGLG